MVDDGNGTSGGLRKVRLKTPVTDEDLAGLRLGDVVYLDGIVYTGREGVYHRAIVDGIEPPVDLKTLTNVTFHCSPAASVKDDGSFDIGAVTATASFRFARYLTEWFELSGVKIIMGKGGMSEEDYRKYFVPNKAIYLTTVGYGTGALLGRGITRVRDVLWLDELGIAQAIWVLEVENFGPFLVECDLQGNSLFERENRKTKAQVAEAFKGLKEPALKRSGETTSREDEVV
ncbi:MAG: fumarate hydratase C-terminal domain-containing protein [Pseudomonadota bacterium]